MREAPIFVIFKQRHFPGREMYCDCPFHDPEKDQTIVGYRHDLPTKGRPVRGHGLVCTTCAVLYQWRVGNVPYKYGFTFQEYVSWVCNPKSILLPDEIVAIHAPSAREYSIVFVAEDVLERKLA